VIPDPDPLFTAEDELASYERRRPAPALVLALVVGGLVVAGIVWAVVRS
jgi:hypothetical protein